MLREIANEEQNLGVNWPVMFDERALVRSQAQEQGRRLHDEENDIDGKLAQDDVSSCTEKLFPSHYHNQLAPSSTSVRCRREYWRWKHLLYCNPKNANFEIAVRAEPRRIIVRKQVCTKRSKKSRPGSCWLLNSTRWTWWHWKHDYNT